ncbi:Fis family transcriptional regulator [Ectothiorhodospira haloalkaliphila]|uniref:Fis family transcriptional regulator n=1 Tax=Ectothiorhodospira haloalkaliphila TaxID=421628 RepID=W8KXJ8_9GAMM|nr:MULTISPECIES: PEP-CTERM-box response regulator transcription factor [Ectothiorhodospira]AHK80261.1 Fis family transcriptional regulator [Ectothiorhodospira haloalkaliphila]MCG5495261.1 PEP-CTERM-box response regulator transcription factor [Ectothiorhodospira variabilis]MCG5498421.1 PEP-CTERM-box response regulator transcription factor [Ectothiorhodospira variabilis]MCG5504189.1 PEP-CTERM-box response regulator transcription factor [Ectothiorhodospira variabilis]MCG5507344.1 PEP-CTERM-box re
MTGSTQQKPTLLLVEDDPGLLSQLRWCFSDFEVLTAKDRDEAITQLRRGEPQVVTLDLGLPPDPGGATEGLATLEQILALAPNTKVIVVTGNNDRDNAVKAVALGAYDFYQKPVDADILDLIVQRAHRLYELEAENRRLADHRSAEPLPGLIASSPEMLKVCRTVEKVAPTDATTLLLGDSGTGKEVIARALHDLSPRSKEAFVAINCAAIPENLLESELFGYEKGAFTGANKQTKGKIEYASGGTLFLDEVGDLPMALQAKLLRFLQERVIDRIGGREGIPVDVRVVCATHQDLSGLIAEDAFREDLFYRISEITIAIPPLKDRTGDAHVLARLLLKRFADQQGRPIKGFAPDAVQAIEHHTWPGNVREMENRIKRAVIMADANQVTAEDLELSPEGEDPMMLNLRQVRDEAEGRAVRRAMQMVDGNISRAAELLGVSRPTLYDLMKKHEMGREG